MLVVSVTPPQRSCLKPVLLTDEAGVVLGAATQDLDDALNLLLAPHAWVQLALSGREEWGRQEGTVSDPSHEWVQLAPREEEGGGRRGQRPSTGTMTQKDALTAPSFAACSCSLSVCSTAAR